MSVPDVAVLCPAGADLDPSAAAALAAELTAALTAAGAREVRALTAPVTSPVGAAPIQAAAPIHAGRAGELREIAALARAGAGPLLLCADNLVAHPSLLWMLATDPVGRTSALVTPPATAQPAGLREDRGRLVAATELALPTARFVGALAVAPADLPRLAEIAERLAVVATTGPLLDALLAGLIAAGVAPVALRVRLLHAEQVADDTQLAAAQAAVAAIDEDRARLRLAVKEHDDFFTTYAVSSWSPLVTKLAARLRLTPSGVTALSVLLAIGAGLAFWQASRPAMLVGAVLLYLGFVLDCVDGQLARYTRSFGPFGGWLDTMADRAKEYAAYAGLAAGADRIGLPGAWQLGIAAMLLQTVRHMTDAWYGALHDEAARRPASAGAGIGGRLTAASNRVQGDTGSPAYWLKRIVVFPIGERWALIGVLAIVGNGRVALIGVLAWGVFAAAYTLGLRSLRSLSMRVPVMPTVDIARHRDDGLLARWALGGPHPPRLPLGGPLPLAALAAGAAGVLAAFALAGTAIAPTWIAVVALLVLLAALPAGAAHAGPLDWLTAAALRAGEYLFVAAVGLAGHVPLPLIFLLIFALALHHYDLVARMEKGAPVGPARRAVAGWVGRVAILAVAGVVGLATAGTLLVTVVVLVMFGYDAATAAAASRRAR
jgi:phosphatidylglycerophosphate synthase